MQINLDKDGAENDNKINATDRYNSQINLLSMAVDNKGVQRWIGQERGCSLHISQECLLDW